MRLPRKAVFLLLLLMPLKSLYGNPKIIWHHQVNNVHITSTTASPVGLSFEKLKILATLTSRWCQHLQFNSPVLIDAGNQGVYPDSQLAYVRIDSFNWHINGSNKKYGLVIKLFLPGLDITDRFNIIANSLIRYDSLPTSHHSPGETPQFGTRINNSSIPIEKIKKYIVSPVDEAEFVYDIPVNINYRSPTKPISFFYLENQFHFYISDSTLTIETLLKDRKQFVLLSTPNLFEIITFATNSFIFDLDNQFYIVANHHPSTFKNPARDTKGPYFLNGVKIPRSLTLEHYEQFRGAHHKQYFTFLNANGLQKVLVLPDKGIAISDYQEKETSIINSALSENDSSGESKRNSEFNSTIPMLLISILLAGLVLSLTLKKRSGR